MEKKQNEIDESQILREWKVPLELTQIFKLLHQVHNWIKVRDH